MKGIVYSDDNMGWYVFEMMVTEGGDHKVKHWYGGGGKGWLPRIEQVNPYQTAMDAVTMMNRAVPAETSRPESWRVEPHGEFCIVRDNGEHRIFNPEKMAYWTGNDWCPYKTMAKVYHAKEAAEIAIGFMPKNSGIPWFCQHTTGFGLEADGRRWEVGL